MRKHKQASLGTIVIQQVTVWHTTSMPAMVHCGPKIWGLSRMNWWRTCHAQYVGLNAWFLKCCHNHRYNLFHSQLNYVLDEARPAQELIVRDGPICLTREDFCSLGLCQNMESNVSLYLLQLGVVFVVVFWHFVSSLGGCMAYWIL